MKKNLSISDNLRYRLHHLLIYVFLIGSITLVSCGPIAPSECLCKGKDFYADCDDDKDYLGNDGWDGPHHCRLSDEENKAAAQADADEHNGKHKGHTARVVWNQEACHK